MGNNRIDYSQLSGDEVLKNFKTRESGLSDSEVQNRLKIYGVNKLVTSKGDSLFVKILSQFKDLMVIILIVAGALSLYMGSSRDAVIMFTIVLINAFIGFIQEYKAEKIMASLKNLVKAKAKVMRAGKEMEIDGEYLVPGDIVKLEEGDAVPADIRILVENNLGTNDFSLTGESNPARKFTHKIGHKVQIGDRGNLVFMGTTVATGNGFGVVVHTGMQTEIGLIANLSQETVGGLSPLQKELNHLSKNITFVTLVVTAILFIIGLSVHFTLNESFIFAIGIAAACVPEGLPAQVTVALSLAAGRLAKKNAIIKKLSAVETLGSTHIICTDKTGTLTKNEMTVQRLLIGGKEFDVTGSGYKPEGFVVDSSGKNLSKEDIEKYILFFETGVFASNAKVNPPDEEHKDWYSIGDPTEAALISLGEKIGLDPVKMDKDFPEIKEFPFDAVRKLMTSMRHKDGKHIAFVKGSPQSLMERCTKIWDGEIVREITKEDIDIIIKKDDEFAGMALRNLAYAYREVPNFNNGMKMEDVEKELIFLGLAAMIDPPREEVKAAMDAAFKANIRVIIITGDYALTAEAIARRVGLGEENGHEITVVNGDELQALTDVELLHKLINSNLIFSRTSPEDKLRIVQLLKKTGEIVAVTGDGVNDAPALKKADIGVAMGKTGTEVAKDSAGIVLLDDSFATLVTAIKEGRTIFQNLKKTILSSLTANGGELFAVLISLVGTSIFGFPAAILAVQILAVDLVGEMLPLTFLTWDPPQPRIMTDPPRNPDEHIMNKHSLIDLAWTGFIMGAIGYANFFYLFVREGVSLVNVSADNPFYLRATTLTYISIVFVQWMNILSRRAGGREFVLSSYLWSNKRLLTGYVISFGFLLLIVYSPFVSQFLGTAPLTLMDWSYAVLGGLVYLMIREGHKFFYTRFLVKKVS
jgi:Ca2+-transporting ATPase